MKHLDFGQALVRLPMAARLVKAVPVWMLLASAIGPLTAQQLFVNAASGVDTNPGTREQPLRSVPRLFHMSAAPNSLRLSLVPNIPSVPGG
jgi:hypothetical protein